RAPRQPGQVRKEAAVTSFRPGRLPASHLPRRLVLRQARDEGLFSVLVLSLSKGEAPGAAAPHTLVARPPMNDAPDSPGNLFGSPDAAAPAYRVLARKYRPTTFRDMIGQDALVR